MIVSVPAHGVRVRQPADEGGQLSVRTRVEHQVPVVGHQTVGRNSHCVAQMKQTALDLVLETVEDLFEERGEEEKVWGSMVKQALKRRNPGFSESSHGFRNFGQLLEEAQARKLLRLERDDKSGGYVIKGFTHGD